jgi:hypothetical protein
MLFQARETFHVFQTYRNYVGRLKAVVFNLFFKQDTYFNHHGLAAAYTVLYNFNILILVYCKITSINTPLKWYGIFKKFIENHLLSTKNYSVSQMRPAGRGMTTTGGTETYTTQMIFTFVERDHADGNNK